MGPVLTRQRQENSKFQASLAYRMSSRIVRGTQRILISKTNIYTYTPKKKKKKKTRRNLIFKSSLHSIFPNRSMFMEPKLGFENGNGIM